MKNVLDTLQDPMYKIMYRQPNGKIIRNHSYNYSSMTEANKECLQWVDKDSDGNPDMWAEEFIPRKPTARQMKLLIHLNNVGYDRVANCQRAAGLMVTECGSRAKEWHYRGWVDYAQEPDPRKGKAHVWMVYLKWITKYKERFGKLPSDELITLVSNRGTWS